jgi:hypothetical protein
MLALTDYGADLWSGILVGVGSLPATFYVAALIGEPDVSVDGTVLANYEPPDTGVYARQALGKTSTNWSGPSSGIMTAIPTITFPTSVVAWGKVVGVALCDAASAGNVLATGPIDTPIYVDTGYQFLIDSGQLSLGLSSPSDGGSN